MSFATHGYTCDASESNQRGLGDEPKFSGPTDSKSAAEPTHRRDSHEPQPATDSLASLNRQEPSHPTTATERTVSIESEFPRVPPYIPT